MGWIFIFCSVVGRPQGGIPRAQLPSLRVCWFPFGDARETSMHHHARFSVFPWHAFCFLWHVHRRKIATCTHSGIRGSWFVCSGTLLVSACLRLIVASSAAFRTPATTGLVVPPQQNSPLTKLACAAVSTFPPARSLAEYFSSSHGTHRYGACIRRDLF